MTDKKTTGKKLRGTVVKLSSDKTIKVAVSRFVQDKKYKKYIKKIKRYLVHDPKMVAQEGDTVEIIESRPISKMKKFKLFSIIKKVEVKD